jgi:hypothetical protein
MIVNLRTASVRTLSWQVRGGVLALPFLIACGNAVSEPDHGPLDGSGAPDAGAGGAAEKGGRAGAEMTPAGRGGAQPGAENGGDGGSGPTANAGSPDFLKGGTSPIGGASTGGGASAAGRASTASGGAGSAAGRASTGGNGGGVGASGGASEVALLLPPGCEPRGRSEDSDTCFLGVFCDAVPNLTNCRRLASGNWQCSCELSHSDRVYEIDGAPGLQACAVASGLCAEDELELGAETCTAPLNSSTADSCDVEVSCGRPITVLFAPDVRASLMKYGAATCLRTGSSELFECRCDRGEEFEEYGLLADSGTLACRPLADFCMSAAEPTFDQPLTCVDTAASSSDDGCQLEQGCGAPMRLTNEVRLEKVEPRGASCTPSESGGSRCNCSGRDSLFQFDVEADSAPATCASASLNCDEDASIAARGEVSCHPTSQTDYGDACNSDLDCWQPASVDGRNIVARGRLGVYCRREAAEQPWWCSCASNQDSTIFEYGTPSASGTDVCAAAPQRCLEQMPVFIGPYGEYRDPPDPLM